VSMKRRLEHLEGCIEPPEDEAERRRHEERRDQIRWALNEQARIYRQEGQAIEDRTTVLEEQGYSHRDARIIAKDEILRAHNPEVADFNDSAFPPEIREDPVAKRDWLERYIRDRSGRPART
jgi:hypothetical protein